MGADAARRYRADVERRAAGEPVAYLRGIKEFYGLAFEADPRALIPRPETERLVELARSEVMRRLGAVARGPGSPPLRIVDVGTGSGAIAVALAVTLRGLRALDAVEILAVDISPDALDLARENAVGHAVADRIAFAEADLLPVDAVEATAEPARTVRPRARQPAVRPTRRDGRPAAGDLVRARLALDGGAEGLEIIGRLLDRLPSSPPTAGSPCSRSGPTRARRSSSCRRARRGCPGRAGAEPEWVRRTDWPGWPGGSPDSAAAARIG